MSETDAAPDAARSDEIDRLRRIAFGRTSNADEESAAEAALAELARIDAEIDAEREAARLAAVALAERAALSVELAADTAAEAAALDDAALSDAEPVEAQPPRWRRWLAPASVGLIVGASAELFDAEINSVHIRGGKIDYLNLRSARLTNVLIEDCQIGELDLGSIRGDRVAIRNCRIGTLDLTRATCANVDIRGSEFSTVNGLEGLRGVTVDEPQLALLAPVLAAHIGLVVE